MKLACAFWLEVFQVPEGLMLGIVEDACSQQIHRRVSMHADALVAPGGFGVVDFYGHGPTSSSDRRDLLARKYTRTTMRAA